MTNHKIYVRQYYMDKIKGFINSDLIKVITGIRRCGKSCFMLSVINELLSCSSFPFPSSCGTSSEVL